MKQPLLKLRALVTLLIILIGTNAVAKDFTYDFTSSIPSGWTASTAPFGFESTSRGCQFTASSVLTLAGAKNVTKVVVTCSSNVAGKNSIALSVGGTAMGESISMSKETNVEKTFTGATLSGNIALSITRTEKSVYIKQIVVTADEVGGTDDNDDKGDDKGDELDPGYTYDEPTIITPSGQTGSNTPYSFIQNNIRVETSTGAQQASYFGCNAGNSITFTATQEIRGLVINGYVKKEFSATCSSGDIVYVDASEDEVTADPVVVIYDIDAKSVTIECEKQMRCYSVEVYFNDNPDAEIDNPTGDDGEFSYDYEPTTPTTLNITFDSAEAEDYSEYYGFDYTDIYFISDDFEMELAVFAPMVEGTILAPGTYIINDTYEPGTVQASPGGDDYYDYPSFIATDFEEYDGDWMYNTSYYLVSGTLTVTDNGNETKMVLNAKTYYGSTVKATYTATSTSINSVKETETTTPRKQLIGGRIIITRDGKQYSIDGVRVK